MRITGSIGKIEQRNKRLNEEAGKLEVWHSLSYHNHFDGYAEYYEPGKKRAKLCRIYVGEYYRQKLPCLEAVLHRFVYTCLFAGALFCCVTGACIPAASNCIWYVNLPQAITLPCAFYGFLALAAYIGMPEMTKKGHHRFAVQGLRRGTCLTGCSCLISSAATVIFMILGGELHNRTVLQCGILFAAAGVGFLTICLIERKVSYDIIENKAIAPAGSVLL